MTAKRKATSELLTSPPEKEKKRKKKKKRIGVEERSFLYWIKRLQFQA
jgi:hypothetical protein